MTPKRPKGIGDGDRVRKPSVYGGAEGRDVGGNARRQQLARKVSLPTTKKSPTVFKLPPKPMGVKDVPEPGGHPTELIEAAKAKGKAPISNPFDKLKSMAARIASGEGLTPEEHEEAQTKEPDGSDFLAQYEAKKKEVERPLRDASADAATLARARLKLPILRPRRVIEVQPQGEDNGRIEDGGKRASEGASLGSGALRAADGSGEGEGAGAVPAGGDDGLNVIPHVQGSAGGHRAAGGTTSKDKSSPTPARDVLETEVNTDIVSLADVERIAGITQTEEVNVGENGTREGLSVQSMPETESDEGTEPDGRRGDVAPGVVRRSHQGDSAREVSDDSLRRQPDGKWHERTGETLHGQGRIGSGEAAGTSTDTNVRGGVRRPLVELPMVERTLLHVPGERQQNGKEVANDESSIQSQDEGAQLEAGEREAESAIQGRAQPGHAHSRGGESTALGNDDDTQTPGEEQAAHDTSTRASTKAGKGMDGVGEEEHHHKSNVQTLAGEVKSIAIDIDIKAGGKEQDGKRRLHVLSDIGDRDSSPMARLRDAGMPKASNPSHNPVSPLANSDQRERSSLSPGPGKANDIKDLGEVSPTNAISVGAQRALAVVEDTPPGRTKYRPDQELDIALMLQSNYVVCNSCPAAENCPEYKPNYECAYEEGFQGLTSADLANIIPRMEVIADLQMKRGLRAAMLEAKVANGQLDPNVSRQLEIAAAAAQRVMELKAPAQKASSGGVQIINQLNSGVPQEGVLTKLIKGLATSGSAQLGEKAPSTDMLELNEQSELVPLPAPKQ